MSKPVPKVLILGRPNVGKSTLINRITGTKQAITDETAGVTRDVKHYPVSWNGVSFEILDSGGVVFAKKDSVMQKRIETSVQRVFDQADQVLFLVDGVFGIHPVDQTIVRLLRPIKHKVLLVVNKLDNQQRLQDIANFYKLGLGDPYGISAIQGLGVADVLDKLVSDMHHLTDIVALHEKSFRVAIVGRPNVGKSSLLNALVNDERVIVDNQAGTTRDAVEVFFRSDGHDYVFVDTAGMRRKTKIKDSIEYYSLLRADRVLQAADLVVMVLDSEDLLSDQDKKIIQLIIQSKRHMLLFVNKWDLTERTDPIRKDMIRIIEHQFPALAYYPILFGSALTKSGLGKLFQTIPDVIDRGKARVTTSEMNQFVDAVIKKSPPPAKKGRRLKVYYATQAEISPPTFVFFVNDGKLVTREYRRFLERQIRSFFGTLRGCALRIKCHGRARLEKERLGKA